MITFGRLGRFLTGGVALAVVRGGLTAGATGVCCAAGPGDAHAVMVSAAAIPAARPIRHMRSSVQARAECPPGLARCDGAFRFCIACCPDCLLGC